MEIGRWERDDAKGAGYFEIVSLKEAGPRSLRARLSENDPSLV